MRLGSIPGLRVNRAKYGARSDPITSLPRGEKRAWVQCPCGRGTQDAVHFFHECAYTDAARAEALENARSALLSSDLPDVKLWSEMPPEWQNTHVLSHSRGPLQDVAETLVRSAGAKAWVRHAKLISAQWAAADSAHDSDSAPG